jgi:hypothetical protein
MKKIYKQLELAFWNAVIPLLSESQFVRGSLKEVHDLYAGMNSRMLYLIVFGAGLALVAGFILGRTRLFFG